MPSGAKPPILGQPRAPRSSGRRLEESEDTIRGNAYYLVSRDRAAPSGAERFFESEWSRKSGRAYSSVGSERTPDKREVGGSNPPRPTIFRRTA